MAEKKLDYNALAQAVDTTFGRSSTPKTSSYSVKVNVVGPEMLNVSFAAVVNFGNEREMILMKRQYADEARSIVREVLKRVKETYKELTGSSLKITERDPVDSLEIINFNVHNPKRTAYYRSKCLVEVG